MTFIFFFLFPAHLFLYQGEWIKQSTADLAVNKQEGKILPWPVDKHHSFCRLSANSTTLQLCLSDILGATLR